MSDRIKDMIDATPSPARRVPKVRLIVRLHRWISLTFAAFWLIQAATGVLIMFHWELDDATVAGAHRPTDLVAIDRRLAALAPPGSTKHVVSIWTTAGAADRYDITVADSATDSSRSLRVAGDGGILRDRYGDERGVIDTLVSIHQTLLAGDTGEWIVGISGIVLLGNLGLALVVAWPRRGQWRRSVAPSRTGAPVARFYGWHRAVGLWAVLPAFCLVAAGTMLRFEDGVSDMLGAHDVAPPPIVTGRPVVPVSVAVRAAQSALPGSLTAVTMPTATDETYRVRLLAPGEIRRAYGTSIVFVDGATGVVRGIAPAANASPAKSFVDALYTVHTGEVGGLIGRLLVLSLGLWLASMTVLGVLLWDRRRPRARH